MDEISLGLCRVVIGIQLTLVGVQLPYKYPWVEIKSLAVLLLPVMTLMWLATTFCIWVVIPSLPLLPVWSSQLPQHRRIQYCPTQSSKVLSRISTSRLVFVTSSQQKVEPMTALATRFSSSPYIYSSSNPLRRHSPHGSFQTCLYTVGGAVVYGIVVGYVCRRLIEFSTDRNLIDKESFLLYGSAMGVFIIGSGGVLQFDDLLAAFVAGNALSWTDFYREQCEESEVDNCLDLLLNLVFFSFLGATIPWDAFNDPENGITPPKLFLMCILVLLLRRLPAMLAFYRYVPTLHDISEACFIGYFAPIGAGAMFYLGVILDEFKADDPSPVSKRIRVLAKPITYALILSSIIGHSLAIPLVKIAFKYWDVKSIKMQGESEQGDDEDKEVEDGESEGEEEEQENSEDSPRARDYARPIRTRREEETVEDEYEQGDHWDPRYSRSAADSRRSSRATESDHSESYRHSTVHRPENRRHSSQLREELESRGAFHVMVLGTTVLHGACRADTSLDPTISCAEMNRLDS